jgi:uncharacterized protein (TIGR02246 family)
MIDATMKGRILFLAILVAALGGSAKAQTTGAVEADPEAIKEEVRKVDEEGFQAVLKADADTLNRIYADDVAFTYASGQVVSKAQAVDDIRSGRNKLFQLNHDDIHIRVYGDTVVLTGRSQSTLRCCSLNAKPSEVHRRFTNVYKKLDGRWQLIAHQVTPIAQE